jgi:hypothetical protein
MNVKKPLVIASMAAALGLGFASTQASAADPALGALVGGGVGAAIGHSFGGRDATAAGAVVGAVAGASIAANANDPYYNGYYAPPPAPVYSAPAPAYDPYYGGGPAPVYSAPVYSAPVYAAPVYAGPSLVIGTGPYYYGSHHVYRHWDGGRWDHRH